MTNHPDGRRTPDGDANANGKRPRSPFDGNCPRHIAELDAVLGKVCAGFGDYEPLVEVYEWSTPEQPAPPAVDGHESSVPSEQPAPPAINGHEMIVTPGPAPPAVDGHESGVPSEQPAPPAVNGHESVSPGPAPPTVNGHESVPPGPAPPAVNGYVSSVPSEQPAPPAVNGYGPPEAKRPRIWPPRTNRMTISPLHSDESIVKDGDDDNSQSFDDASDYSFDMESQVFDSGDDDFDDEVQRIFSGENGHNGDGSVTNGQQGDNN